MSRTCYVDIDGRGFWSLDDALQVWLAFLVEQADNGSGCDGGWCAEQVGVWRVVAAGPDYGCSVSIENEQQRRWLRGLAASTRRVVVAAGDIGEERLREWMILPDRAVSGGMSRTKGGVGVDRILEVADGFIALLNGNFPADPESGSWFLGTGDGMRAITHRGSHIVHGAE